MGKTGARSLTVFPILQLGPAASAFAFASAATASASVLCLCCCLSVSLSVYQSVSLAYFSHRQSSYSYSYSRSLFPTTAPALHNIHPSLPLLASALWTSLNSKGKRQKGTLFFFILFFHSFLN